MCCNLLNIEEIKKPAGKWCPHCEPNVGCKIYGEHPESCKIFRCLWINEPNLMALDEQRPDKSHVILWVPVEGDQQVCASVDPLYPDAYKSSMFDAVFQTLINNDWFITVAIGRWGRKVIGSQKVLARVMPSLKKIFNA